MIFLCSTNWDIFYMRGPLLILMPRKTGPKQWLSQRRWGIQSLIWSNPFWLVCYRLFSIYAKSMSFKFLAHYRLSSALRSRTSFYKHQARVKGAIYKKCFLSFILKLNFMNICLKKKKIYIFQRKKSYKYHQVPDYLFKSFEYQ